MWYLFTENVLQNHIKCLLKTNKSETQLNERNLCRKILFNKLMRIPCQNFKIAKIYTIQEKYVSILYLGKKIYYKNDFCQ